MAIPFKRINLNLILHLDALLSEKSVSAAAEKVFVSQPAMSSSLKQLRELFKDPLLIPGKGEYFLSPKAKELQPQLEQVMFFIRNILQPNERFDPLRTKRSFKIALPDYVELILLPSLMAALEKLPHIVIETTIQSMADDPHLFIDENVDLAIGAINENSLSAQLKVEKLYEEEIICFASKNNPLINRPLSLEDYISNKHIAFSFNQERYSHSAEYLYKRKLVRNDMLFVKNILPAIFAVANSDAVISTAPSFLINMFARQFNLGMQALPFNLEPTPIYLVTHSKSQYDEGVSWLAKLISSSIKSPS
ncbi:TPA: LysR family transcriptional regulator LelA [Legionella pneumophila]|uniref:LysR family transcriptional regulator n=1 Tax=Legionella pneumophila subsp. pneumophila TaxID=91891 RepID=A0A3A6U597_LEGPN|nr:LysR family transcriptional regulator [Legionella pneumophila]ERH43094.1 LysR family transcriptional regulator [Legionella pneumophila str. Leg01/11]ERH44422.1 LysR family transcriptional regulator [Legionella pneumophila str. Leg01/53]ERI48397.1 LysR family transcriptional regulator [Legionella pneumophila str. Leg01/20]ANN96460.1 LysR family transcriptional regulator [Legionella pneumophila]ERB40013.1 LysR family transcriptional regulator [Legionella pneumophila str. 121004]